MRKVYLDNASTTRLIPEVKAAMLPYMEEYFGNPSSLHDWGDAPRGAGLPVARFRVWRPLLYLTLHRGLTRLGCAGFRGSTPM